MRVVVPGVLLAVLLGCGGFSEILEQSMAEGFDQEFVNTCLEEHAPNLTLTNPQQACECAKGKVEAMTEDNFERLAAIADVDQMRGFLETCQSEMGGGATEADGGTAEPEDVEIPE